VVSDAQQEKASSPMVLTLSGMVTEVRDAQKEKA